MSAAAPVLLNLPSCIMPPTADQQSCITAPVSHAFNEGSTFMHAELEARSKPQQGLQRVTAAANWPCEVLLRTAEQFLMLWRAQRELHRLVWW